MPEPVKVAVIYYSATGGVHTLAEAVARGAEEAGAEVRLRQVRELAPAEAIASNQGWAAHRARTGRNLFDELLERERADGRRIVLDTDHWTAFVPYAARWPYEVHLYPKRRLPDLRALSDAERAAFPAVYLELLRRFDRIFGPDQPRTPYISGWHQAPFSLAEETREDFALHLELFTIRRSPGKLKYLAGSESGMGAFVSDVLPEAAAGRLREVASGA